MTKPDDLIVTNCNNRPKICEDDATVVIGDNSLDHQKVDNAQDDGSKVVLMKHR